MPACGPFIRNCGTPFGGPASGLWPSGTVGPSGVTPCRTADLFSQCFQGCDHSAIPDCGWAKTGGGTVVFGPDHVTMGSNGILDDGIIERPAPGLPSTGYTLQFNFTELPFPPTALMAYEVGFFDALGNVKLDIDFAADGSVAVLTDLFRYDADPAWTPVAGATHTAHVTVDAAGLVRVFLDGAEIALVQSPHTDLVGTPDSVSIKIQDKSKSGQGSFQNIFMASGVLSEKTVFCC